MSSLAVLDLGEHSFDEFPLSFAGFCGLPPLHGDIGYVQVQNKTGVIRIVLLCMPTYPKPYFYHSSGMFSIVCSALPYPFGDRVEYRAVDKVRHWFPHACKAASKLRGNKSDHFVIFLMKNPTCFQFNSDHGFWQAVKSFEARIDTKADS